MDDGFPSDSICNDQRICGCILCPLNRKSSCVIEQKNKVLVREQTEISGENKKN
jgi:hypothetical protein